MFYYVFFLLTAFVVGSTAKPLQKRAFVIRNDYNGCYQINYIPQVYTRYSENEEGELIAENVTTLEEARICCDGHLFVNSKCIPEVNRVLVCGNATCSATPKLECIIFNKCGVEIALFMQEGRIARECYDNHIDPFLCSGVCIQDSCLGAECSAFAKNEVSCFSGCDCQATWIRLKDRVEVNCLTGQVSPRKPVKLN